MPNRNTFLRHTWLDNRFRLLNIPGRTQISPDDLQLEDLEDNVSSMAQGETTTPVSPGDRSPFHSNHTNIAYTNADRDPFIDAVMLVMLACRQHIYQCFSSILGLAKALSAYGRDIVMILGALHQILGFCAISSYLDFLQMIFDIEKGLEQVSFAESFYHYLGLLQDYAGIGGYRDEVLPYNRVDAQPPYLRSAQHCFICVDFSGDDAKALQVRLKRPMEHREIGTWSTDKTGNLKSIRYNNVRRCDWAVESDAGAYAKIRKAFLLARSGWVRFMPFYGITSVREVEVRTPSSSNELALD
jgi:hypothetical protein